MLAAVIATVIIAPTATLTGNVAPTSPGGPTYVSVLKTSAVPYQVVYEFDRTLSPGRMKKIRDGRDGTKLSMIQEVRVGGKIVKTQVLWETTEPPVSAVISIGRPSVATTRGSFVRQKVVTMKASAYCPGSCCGSGDPTRTAIGMRAGHGIAAVDPRVIKMRTMLFIEGYGFAIAGDTGGAIKGNRIDLCFQTHTEALKFGRRNVRVHILG
ncbi:hypothetical protein FCG40_08655 [Fimbriimonadia bacterium ATM]|nr:MAG: hypothetical protein EDM73_01855 [Armatimonadota bacterium]MBC6970370.1 hypothetical protein [Armatimonadota bacterium]MCE7899775.1 hypothetical protein [Armatimonadetes bacterium ATM1]MDL1929047.1 hypothetical protein [Fimbriimonadia bacterium ATM]RIJ95884.1 MAG: hypothetical protein DCC45_08455 [Armatimonadota bacterium]